MNNAERFTERKVKAIRTDGGTEFVNHQFLELCEKLGIEHQKTNPYTPEHNSVVERFNYTAVNGINVLLRESGLSQGFWGEALRHFTHTWNRVVHKGTKTPCELYSGKKPSVHYFKPFGVKVYCGIPKQIRSKFDMRAKQGVLTGYALQTRGYRIWIPSEHKIIETINVRIDETGKNEIPKIGEEIDFEMLFPTNNEPVLIRSYVEPSCSQKVTEVEKTLTPEESEQPDPKLKPSDVKNESEEIPPEVKTHSKISWTRKCVPKSDGSRIYIYYYPEGSTKRFQTLKEIKAYCLSKNIDFDETFFDFSSKNPFEGVVSNDQIAGSSFHTQ